MIEGLLLPSQRNNYSKGKVSVTSPLFRQHIVIIRNGIILTCVFFLILSWKILESTLNDPQTDFNQSEVTHTQPIHRDTPNSKFSASSLYG